MDARTRRQWRANGRRTLPWLLLAPALLAIFFCSPAQADDPLPVSEPGIHTVGNAADVSPESEFGLALVGGGGRCPEAYRWLIERSGGGDFVFLTTATYSDQEDEEFFAEMSRLGAIDSITTLTVASRARADAPEVEGFIRSAELVFIDGGDQAEYYELWKDTRLHRALRDLFAARDVPVGGTSAGMAVLSGLAYIPERQGVTSAEALADPFHANMAAIRKDFLLEDFLLHTITDTHWSERNRCGRTIAFLARIVADGLAPLPWARAISCDERTAVCIDDQAQAVVFGRDDSDDYAYFISCRSAPDRCLPGQPLHWPAAVSIWKLRGSHGGSGRFDLAAWQTGSGTRHDVNVDNGALSVDIQTPR